jgi:hypothetical protein
MKRLKAFVAGLVAAALLAGCGPTTFIISKDGRAYYLGRKSQGLYDMICSSGDLKRVLEDTSIPEDLRKEFYRYNCTEEHSKEKVVSLYLFLSPEEKEELKSAFRRHGYTINFVPC